MAAGDFDSHKMDVKTTFLILDLADDVYMELPEKFIDASSPDHVCKLKKELYSLRQPPHQRF